MATITPTQNYVKGKRLRYSVSAVLNERPTITGSIAPSFTEGTGDTYDLSQFVTNPGGAPLTYTIEQGPLPTGVTLNSSTGLLTYDGEGAATTSAGLTFGVNDGISTIESDAFSVVVNALSAFTPLRSLDFENGTVGQEPTDVSGTNGLISTEQAFSGTQSWHNTISAGQFGDFSFGGYVNFFSSPLVGGQEIWVRCRTFWPIGSTYDSPTFALKFIRVSRQSPSGANRGYNDLYIRPEGSNPPFRLQNEGTEGSDNAGDTRLNIGTPSQSIVRGVWETYESYFLLDHTESGISRHWKNGELIGEVTDITMNAADDVVPRVLFFTYWNGAAPADSEVFIDDIVIATSDSPPTNTDAAGNLMIGV